MEVFWAVSEHAGTLSEPETMSVDRNGSGAERHGREGAWTARAFSIRTFELGRPSVWHDGCLMGIDRF